MLSHPVCLGHLTDSLHAVGGDKAVKHGVPHSGLAVGSHNTRCGMDDHMWGTTQLRTTCCGCWGARLIDRAACHLTHLDGCCYVLCQLIALWRQQKRPAAGENARYTLSDAAVHATTAFCCFYLLGSSSSATLPPCMEEAPAGRHLHVLMR
jgi:hypothetical protein